MSMRAPYELEVGAGRAVRGIVLTGDGASTIVMVHDRGRDLDEFGQVPEVLAGGGSDVIVVDLPGHGLSDGEDDAASIIGAVSALGAALSADGRPVVLVASGRTATAGMVLGEVHGLRLQVLVNPILDAELAGTSQREYAQRMVLHGDGENLAGTETQKFFSPLIGEKMLLHSTAIGEGVGSIAEHSLVRNQVELFIKRYLFTTRPGGPGNVGSR